MSFINEIFCSRNKIITNFKLISVISEEFIAVNLYLKRLTTLLSFHWPIYINNIEMYLIMATDCNPMKFSHQVSQNNDNSLAWKEWMSTLGPISCKTDKVTIIRGVD